jgi:hypothetical protein
MLNAQPGDDHFIFILKRGSHPVELHFPNDSTRCTPQLRQQIEGLVGRENLRVVVSAHP